MRPRPISFTGHEREHGGQGHGVAGLVPQLRDDLERRPPRPDETPYKVLIFIQRERVVPDLEALHGRRDEDWGRRLRIAVVHM